MPLSENEWHSLQFIKPHWRYSLVLQSSCSGEQRDAPQGATGVCSAKKEHYSLSHQISTSRLLCKCAKNHSKSKEQLKRLHLYHVAQAVLYCRLSASTDSLLVVSNTSKPQMNSALSCRGYVKQLRRRQSIQEKRISDVGGRIQNCRLSRRVQGSTISPLWKQTALTSNPERFGEEDKDCCSESLSGRVRRELVS